MNSRRRMIILVTALAVGILAAYRSTERGASGSLISRNILRPAHAVSSFMRALRPNYPYSVVPGGVYSPAELRSALERDPVVRDHYAGFNAKAARLVTLAEDRFQYVSYRQNNKVYWTSKKLRISKGEVLLTDGQNFARTRCGNRLSATLHGPTSPQEPSSAQLILPEAKPQSLTVGPLLFAPAPSLGELAQASDTVAQDVPRTVVAAPTGGSPFEGNGPGQAGRPVCTGPTPRHHL